MEYRIEYGKNEWITTTKKHKRKAERNNVNVEWKCNGKYEEQWNNDSHNIDLNDGLKSTMKTICMYASINDGINGMILMVIINTEMSAKMSMSICIWFQNCFVTEILSNQTYAVLVVLVFIWVVPTKWTTVKNSKMVSNLASQFDQPLNCTVWITLKCSYSTGKI